MSKHEVAIALIDEQLEKAQADLGSVASRLQVQRATVERSEKELKFAEHTVNELQTTKNLLVADRAMVKAEPTPTGGW